MLGLRFVGIVCVASALSWSSPGRTNEPEHALGGSLRVSFDSMRDDLIVPLAVSGGGLGLALRYAGGIGDGLMQADLAFGLGYAVDRHGAEALLIRHDIRLRHTFPIYRGAWRVGLGPALGWESDLDYDTGWDDSHIYWMTHGWLGVTAHAWTPIGAAWRLDLDGELGLVGLASRPPPHRYVKHDVDGSLYTFFEHPQADLEPAWLGDFQRVRVAADVWRTRARGPVPDGWAIGAELRFARTDDPALAVALEAALRFTWMGGL